MHAEFMILKNWHTEILHYPNTKILQSYLEELGKT